MSEAERLAEMIEGVRAPYCGAAAAELRRLSAELEGHKAARTAYASEFPLNGEGEPDVGSIHQNIRALKAELAALKAATFTVLEGFTLPHDVRKILESALYTIPKDKP